MTLYKTTLCLMTHYTMACCRMTLSNNNQHNDTQDNDIQANDTLQEQTQYHSNQPQTSHYIDQLMARPTCLVVNVSSVSGCRKNIGS